jgi:hypothetical protein
MTRSSRSCGYSYQSRSPSRFPSGRGPVDATEGPVIDDVHAQHVDERQETKSEPNRQGELQK